MDALRGALRRLRRYGGDGDRQQFWVDSNNVSSCYECGSEFGLFNRKHHCRVCGRVFCGRCTSCRPLPNASYCISGVEPAMEVLSGGYGSGTDERERVCHHCAQELTVRQPVAAAPRMGASGTKPGGSSDPASAPPSEPPTPKAGTAAVRPAVGGGADADGRKTVNRAGGGVASLGSASDNHLAGLAGLLAPGLTPVISWGRAGGHSSATTGQSAAPSAAGRESATAPRQGTAAAAPSDAGQSAGAVARVDTGSSRNGAAGEVPQAGGDGAPEGAAAQAPSVAAPVGMAGVNVSAASTGQPDRRPGGGGGGLPMPLSSHSRSHSLQSISETSLGSGTSSSSLAFTAAQEAMGKKDAKKKRTLSCPGGMRKLQADFNISWAVPPALEGAMNAEELLPLGTVSGVLAGWPAGPEGAPGGWGENGSAQHAAWAPGVEVMQGAFAAVAKKHVDEIAQQLLESEGFGADSPWQPIVQQLAAEAVASVCPRAAACHGESEICFYIKVKCIANVGTPQDSYVVQGIVSRKNPARRDMRHHILNPRVLMLGGSLEFQRTQNRLVGLHTVAQQEREHLRNSVARVAQFQPDVVLVVGTVAQFALDAFQERNITVLLKCGKSLLAAVARCTGASIAPSVEQITQRCVAQCKAFSAINPYKKPRHSTLHRAQPAMARHRVVSFFAPPPQPPPPVDPFLGRPPKGLVLLEGCPQPLGCTIILKGAPLEELVRLKRVLQFLCYSLSHAARECSLLAHVSLLTLRPVTADQDAGRVLPLVNQHILAAAHRAVQRMSGLTEAVRRGELVLSVSPHVVPLHARTASGRLHYGQPTPEAGDGDLLQLSRLGKGSVEDAQARSHLRSASAMPGLAVRERRHGAPASSLGALDMREVMEFGEAVAGHQRSMSHTVSPADMAPSLFGGKACRAGGKELGGANGSGSWGSAGASAAAACLPPWASAEAVAECPEVLYSAQRLFLNVSSMNPDKALLCQVPEVKRLDFYTGTDISLLKFVEALDRGVPFTKPQSTMAKSLVPPEKCPTCGEAPQEHLYTLLHGIGRVTVAVKRLMPDSELPGGRSGRLWLWSRPGGATQSPSRPPPATPRASDVSGTAPPPGGFARRAPLPAEAAMLSLGQFLSLAFGGLHLSTPDGTPLLEKRVLYLGLRRTVVAFHTEKHTPQALLLPRLRLRYVGGLQAQWGRLQVLEIAKEAKHAFAMLQTPLERSSTDEEERRLLLSEIRNDEAQLLAAAAEVAQDCAAPGDDPDEQDDAAPSPTRAHIATVARINNLRRDLAFKVLEWASLLQHPASAYIRTVSTRYSIAPADLENSDATVAALGEGVRVGSAPVAEEPDGGAGLQTGHRRSLSATPTPGGSPADAGDSSWSAKEPMPEQDPYSSSPLRHRRAVSAGQALEDFDPSSVDLGATKDGVPHPLMAGFASDGDLSSKAGQMSPVSPFMTRAGATRPSSCSRLAREAGRPRVSNVEEEEEGTEGQAELAKGRLEGSGLAGRGNLRMAALRSWSDMARAREGNDRRGEVEQARPRLDVSPARDGATSGETAPRSPASPLGLPSREASAGAGSPVAPALSHSHSGRALPKAGSSEIAPGSPAGAGGAPRDAGQQGAGSPVAPALSHTNSGRLPKSKPGGVFLSGRCWLPPGDGDTVISIFDNEPTSVIAHVLQSHDYLQWAEEVRCRLGASAQSKAAAAACVSDSGGEPAAGNHSCPPSPSPAPHASAASTSHCNSSKPSNKVEAEAGPGTLEATPAAAAGDAPSAPSAAPAPPAAAPAPAMGHGAGSNKPQHHHRSSSFVGAILGSVVGGTSSAASGEDGAHQAPEAWHLEEEWFSLLSGEALHYTTTFADAVHESAPKAVFTVTAHFAAQFAALRQRVVQGGEAAFVASMSRCAAWASQGGKSNAYFAKTRDDRFIVKQMAKIEKQSFLEFGPAYFRYLADCMHKDRPTCLAKILGVYEVSIKTSPATSGKGSRGGEGQPTVKVIDVLVMENIFYGHSISRIYDLKGSLRGRYNAAAADPSKSGEVMLDKNLLESMMDHPLCISTADSAELEAALWSDTAFLARLGVMDYSLLVGADSSQSTLVVGVIDFIRQYTIDKQLETLLKSSGLLGGSGQQPTVVSPKQYMRRFRGAMTSYFTVMPDSDPQLPHLNPDH